MITFFQIDNYSNDYNVLLQLLAKLKLNPLKMFGLNIRILILLSLSTARVLQKIIDNK